MAAKSQLIRLLQNAYSGEKAAAYAYRGHALSVSDPTEKAELLKIEEEEWEHRRCIGDMLETLGASPRPCRELLMTLIGCVIFGLCRLGGWFNFFNFGWFMSMYGAGKLEQGNIIEYEIGAREAILCGEHQFVESLIEMAEVEWDHEFYFRKKAQSSKWTDVIRLWNPPPPRHSTREAVNSFKKN